MHIYFNAETILDMVVDGILSKAEIEQISNQLYKDKRGGELAHLWDSQEFITALEEQLA